MHQEKQAYVEANSRLEVDMNRYMALVEELVLHQGISSEGISRILETTLKMYKAPNPRMVEELRAKRDALAVRVEGAIREDALEAEDGALMAAFSRYRQERIGFELLLDTTLEAKWAFGKARLCRDLKILVVALAMVSAIAIGGLWVGPGTGKAGPWAASWWPARWGCSHCCGSSWNGPRCAWAGPRPKAKRWKDCAREQ